MLRAMILLVLATSVAAMAVWVTVVGSVPDRVASHQTLLAGSAAPRLGLNALTIL